jgi:hypothetical protein
MLTAEGCASRRQRLWKSLPESIEPGLFVPGVGGMRVEHNDRITEDGFERLTHHRLTLEP